MEVLILLELLINNNSTTERYVISDDKDNKIKADEGLLTGSEKLDNLRTKSIEDTKEQFKLIQDSGVDLFHDRVELINRMYNEPIAIAVDNDNIYLNIAQSSTSSI